MKPEEIQRCIDYFQSKVDAIEEDLESRDLGLIEGDNMGVLHLLEMRRKSAIEHEAYLQYCKRRLAHYKELL